MLVDLVRNVLSLADQFDFPFEFGELALFAECNEFLPPELTPLLKNLSRERLHNLVELSIFIEGVAVMTGDNLAQKLFSLVKLDSLDGDLRELHNFEQLHHFPQVYRRLFDLQLRNHYELFLHVFGAQEDLLALFY